MAITLTIYDTYGENDTRGKILSLFQKISRQKNRVLMSEGEQELNLVHIEDVVSAYERGLKLLEKEAAGYQVYYIRAKQSFSLKEIAQLYEKIHHTTLPIQWGGKEYRKREVMEVYKGGEALPDWQSKIPLEEGIKRLPPKSL